MAAKDDLSIPLLPGRYYHTYNRGINRCRIFYTEENFKYFLKKYAKKMTGYFDTFAYCLLDNHFHIFVRVCDAEALIKIGLDDFGSVNLTFHKDYVMPWLQRMGLLDLGGSPRSGLLAGVDGKRDQVGDRDRCQEGRGDLTNFQNLSNLFATYGDLHQDTDPYPNNLTGLDFHTQLCSWLVSERFRGFMLGYAKAINNQEQRTGSLFQSGFRRKFIPDSLQDKKQVLWYVHHNPIHHFYTGNYESYQWSSHNSFYSDQVTNLSKTEVIDWFGRLEYFKAFGEEFKVNKLIKYTWMVNEEEQII